MKKGSPFFGTKKRPARLKNFAGFFNNRLFIGN